MKRVIRKREERTGIKMRILFLSAANSAHTVRWVNSLADRGHEVILVSQKDHRVEMDWISTKVKTIYLPVKGKKGYYFNAGFLKVIYMLEHVDVVNAHYASGYGTLARIARLPDVLLSVWGSDVYEFPYESRTKEKILKKNLNYAALIASTSYCMARQTEKIIGKRDMVITPFGVDTERFRKYAEKKNGSFTIGSVKTLSPKYGIDMIIKAFYLFSDQLDDTEHVQLVIFGEGSQRNELVHLCKTLGIMEKVHFEGYIPNTQVPDALNEMDIICFGSKQESFGVAAVEAMSCSIPVIATKVAGYKEVVEEGKTGYLVSYGDTETMAAYMLKLYRDKQLRDEIGRNGRNRVEKLYDWNQCVDTMINSYIKMKSKF